MWYTDDVVRFTLGGQLQNGGLVQLKRLDARRGLSRLLELLKRLSALKLCGIDGLMLMHPVDVLQVLASDELVTDARGFLFQVFTEIVRYLDVVVPLFSRFINGDRAFSLSSHPVAAPVSMVQTLLKVQLAFATVTHEEIEHFKSMKSMINVSNLADEWS